MNYFCGYWTTAVVIELLCGHWTDCFSWTIHTKHKKRKVELLNLYTGLFWYMATCLSVKLPAVGQICLLSLPYKVIANVRQASYCMLVKTEGCSRAGYHGCKTPSYFIINFINFFFLFLFICLFIFLAQSIMKLKQCCTVFRYKIVCVFCLHLLWRKKNRPRVAYSFKLRAKVHGGCRLTFEEFARDVQWRK